MLALTLALCAGFPSALAASASSGAFNVLSFNVAGLPAILQSNEVPGDKTTNTATIGQKFAQYNLSVIHVQEDFNYHATLYANDNHPYRTATSGGAGIGSGLNTLSVFPWADGDNGDVERVKWNTCSDASSNDCLTPKGFTFMRLRVDEGVYFDVYNLHADAGTEAGDETARTANIQQVADYITANSVGNAVLVYGDTNSRYSRSADNPKVFVTQNSLTDAWVHLANKDIYPTTDELCVNPQPASNSSCETVDKVFYRGSQFITLTGTSFRYAGQSFLQPNGSILSDHNPVLVNFTWSLNANFRQSDLFGGPHGTWFNDFPTLSSISGPAVSSITLRGASRLDAVSVVLKSGQNFTHGGTGGTASTLTLNSGETLKSATLCRGQYNSETRNFYANVTTSSGRSISAGTTTSDCVTRTVPSGFGIVGFFGRSEDEVDQLGFVYGKA